MMSHKHSSPHFILLFRYPHLFSKSRTTVPCAILGADCRQTPLQLPMRWHMSENEQKIDDQQTLAKKLSAAGWGAFFIWMGIAFLTNISWGAGLLGVGVIVL